MLSKSIKIRVVITLLSLCVSTAYPLSEKGERNWALGIGTVVGTAVGIGIGLIAQNQKASQNVILGSGSSLGLISFYLTTKLVRRYLHQYTPAPTLESVEEIIKAIKDDAQFAKNFSNLSHDEILRKIYAELGSKTDLEKVINKFKKFDEKIDDASQKLDKVKPDLDRDELRKTYQKLNSEVKALQAYLNLRITLIIIAFATTDKLVNYEFKNYGEFGINGQPTIDSAISYLEKLSRYINNTEKLLNTLKVTQNREFKNSKYSIDELEKCVKFLKNLTALRIAQVQVFAIEKSFALDPILCNFFRNADELSTSLNAHSQTNWPLVTAKQHLNNELNSLTSSYQAVYQTWNALNQLQYSEYAAQGVNLLNKLQTFVNLIENNLALVAKSGDYNYQVGLYEHHLEMERQRKLEEDRIRKQQEMERQRLEQERILQEQRLAQERQLAYEKQYMQQIKAEQQREHERQLLAAKLAHEQVLQQQKLVQQQINKPVENHSTSTYNTYYTNVTTPVVQSEPIYQVVNPAPSAPSMAPEEAHLFGLTTPEYNPNHTPSAPPIEEDTDQPPSYESLYPASSNYQPSAPLVAPEEAHLFEPVTPEYSNSPVY